MSRQTPVLDLADLRVADVAAVYDRVGARVDCGLCYHAAGVDGPACGFPLGVMAAAANPGRSLDTRATAAALALPWDTVMACFGGFGDRCAGVFPDFTRWPRDPHASAYRVGFTLARELRRERPDLFDCRYCCRYCGTEARKPPAGS